MPSQLPNIARLLLIKSATRGRFRKRIIKYAKVRRRGHLTTAVSQILPYSSRDGPMRPSWRAISVRNEEGTEKKFVRAQADINGYVASLGSEDAVVLEASAGALFWAEKIQSQGASCVVIDAYRFRIIRDSWQKTDKRDAANLSLALWMASQSGEMKLPEIWQPGPVVRELRRYFGLYELMNKQIRQLKNEIHGVLLDNGVRDHALGKRLADNPVKAGELLKMVELSAASRVCILTSLALLASLQEQKESLKRGIYQAGRPLEAELKLLIGIRGVTPLLALVFLSEVGDIKVQKRPAVAVIFGDGAHGAL